MDLIGIIIVSPVWGIISTLLFLQSWLAFINLIINLIGLLRGKVERKVNLWAIVVAIGSMLLFSGLLYLGNYLLSNILSFGYTTTENVAYWVFAGLTFLFSIMEFPSKIKKSWLNANIPGSIEEDIRDRRAGL